MLSDPIRDKKSVKRIIDYFKEKEEMRNCVLVLLGICTALRISDLLCLRWKDIYDFSKNEFHTHIHIIEKKTKKVKTIALNNDVLPVLKLLFCERQIVWDAPSFDRDKEEEHLFLNNRKQNPKAITRQQAYRIIRAASKTLKLDGHISCHSLRKTFGYHAWKSGASPALLMDIFNHSSYTITRRYLGIAQDDRDRLYQSLKFA